VDVLWNVGALVGALVNVEGADENEWTAWVRLSQRAPSSMAATSLGYMMSVAEPRNHAVK
jgi:hypothetical protein